MKYLFLGPIIDFLTTALDWIVYIIAGSLALGILGLIIYAIKKIVKNFSTYKNKRNPKKISREKNSFGYMSKSKLESYKSADSKHITYHSNSGNDLQDKASKNSSKLDYDPNIPFFVKAETTLSPGEQYFISILSPLINPNKYKIITQAQYSKYLKPNPNTTDQQQAISASKIKALRGDFAIETQDYRPVMLIEYNDESHKEEDRIIRDNYLHKACKYAQLPRLPVESSHFNSYIFKSEFEARKRLYVLLSLNGNVLCLPDIVCAKCGREFDVITGKFGAFLAHYRDESCHQTVNIFSAKKC